MPQIKYPTLPVLLAALKARRKRQLVARTDDWEEGRDFQRIALTKNQFAIVDNDDYEKLHSIKWKAILSKNGAYYAVTEVCFFGNRTRLRIHRAIMNAPQDMEVDHINRDSLDNRKTNLRLCTRSQNCMNRGIQTNNTSGFTGVFLHNKRFEAQLYVNGKRRYIGVFGTREEAAEARRQQIVKYHGEFANIA